MPVGKPLLPSTIVPPGALQRIIVELNQRGVSMQGAQQLLSGDIVTSMSDRQTVAKIMQQQDEPRRWGGIVPIAPDPSDPSGSTIYIAGASGGAWKTSNHLSPSGEHQLSSCLPLTDPQDRQVLVRRLLFCLRLR
jgi:hypothetical protein